MNRLTFTQPSEQFNGRRIWESERSHDQKAIGAFDLKGAKQAYYMYDLDEFDQGYFAGRVKLRKDERLFRYETVATKIGGMRPLIKVNMKSGLVYFLADLYAEDEEYEFGSVSEKPVWIDIHASFKPTTQA